MKKKKKLKNKVGKKQIFLLGISALIVLALLFLFCVYVFGFFGNKYRIESRTKNVIEAKKKDDENIKTVGWIRVQGTNIDYPVIYAPGYDFSAKVDDFAWIEVEFNELNNIVYISGHNIKNLSKNPIIGDKSHTRFEQLMAYTYYDFVKDNQFIQYTFNGKDYLYKIYSVSYVDFYKLDLYNLGPYDGDRMERYIEATKAQSLFNFDVDVKNTDKIISLDTCTRMYGEISTMHFRVNGRLLRKGEAAKISKVTTNSKYEEIEKIMEGEKKYEDA
ncbi:MAG: class B sortase [Bacilli bacterium]|nr:class B sortase [Bacilli bacterium]